LYYSILASCSSEGSSISFEDDDFEVSRGLELSLFNVVVSIDGDVEEVACVLVLIYVKTSLLSDASWLKILSFSPNSPVEASSSKIISDSSNKLPNSLSLPLYIRVCSISFNTSSCLYILEISLDSWFRRSDRLYL